MGISVTRPENTHRSRKINVPIRTPF